MESKLRIIYSERIFCKSIFFCAVKHHLHPARSQVHTIKHGALPTSQRAKVRCLWTLLFVLLCRASTCRVAVMNIKSTKAFQEFLKLLRNWKTFSFESFTFKHKNESKGSKSFEFKNIFRSFALKNASEIDRKLFNLCFCV